MSLSDFIIRLIVAWLLGAAIGFERQWRQKSAGLRTNTLVSVGSAAYMLLSEQLIHGSGDPTRIAGQIVTGIGFLGAGVIMREGLNIQGLNTAATIWCSAAVGCFASVGLFLEASLISVAIILSHLILRPLGVKLSNLPFLRLENEQLMYELCIKAQQEAENNIRVLLMHMLGTDDYLTLRSLKSTTLETGVKIIAEIVTQGKQENRMEKIAGRLTIESGVTEVSWTLSTQHNDI